MKKQFLLTLAMGLGLSVFSQNPNWAEHVAPIIYNNCTKCHNSNGIGPMPFETYQNAVDFSASIKVAVMTKKMPPWPPDENYRTYAHQRSLTPQQIQTIQDWVDGGTPQGNMALAPTPPTFGANELTNFDMELQIPDYTVNTNNDLYRCFVIPVGNNADRFIKDIEIIPGNRSIVHHVLVYQDPTNTPITLDNNDPEPGYTSFGGTGSNDSKLISGWVPGSMAFKYPDQMGPKLAANTNLVVQIHYPGGTYNSVDSTKIRIKFHPGSARELSIEPVLNHGDLDNGPLIIPANTTKWFYAQYTTPAVYNVSLLNIAPHMHLIGKKIKVYGETATGDTIPLIKIDDWDFHWQGFYSFKNILKIPPGTTLYSEAYYDNTSANHHNPNSPPQLVHAGESTTDEMMVVYFTFTLYLPGDENISQEPPNNGTTSHEEANLTMYIKGIQVYDIYPNPTSQFLNVAMAIPNETKLQFSILDVNGKLVWNNSETLPGGMAQKQISVSNLASGNYFLKVEGNGKTVSKAFIISR